MSKIRTYEDLRDHLETGDIVLCSGDTLLANSIRTVDRRNRKNPKEPRAKADFSHALIIWVVEETRKGEKYKKILCLDAWVDGIELTSFKRRYDDYKGKVVVLRKKRLDKNKAVWGIHSSILPRVDRDESYGHIGLLWRLIYYVIIWPILNWMGVSVETLKSYAKEGKTVCSDLARDYAVEHLGCMNYIGIPLPSPQDLERYFDPIYMRYIYDFRDE